MSNAFKDIADMLDKKVKSKEILTLEEAWESMCVAVPALRSDRREYIKVQIQWLYDVYCRAYQRGSEMGMQMGRQIEKNNEWRKLRETRALK